MGFSFRKSVNLGPFRVNVGKSGVGYSFGGKGIRVGTSAKGRRYTSFSIPGTGVSYRGNRPKVGCVLILIGTAILMATTLAVRASQ